MDDGKGGNLGLLLIGGLAIWGLSQLGKSKKDNGSNGAIEITMRDAITGQELPHGSPYKINAGQSVEVNVKINNKSTSYVVGADNIPQNVQPIADQFVTYIQVATDKKTYLLAEPNTDDYIAGGTINYVRTITTDIVDGPAAGTVFVSVFDTNGNQVATASEKFDILALIVKHEIAISIG